MHEEQIFSGASRNMFNQFTHVVYFKAVGSIFFSNTSSRSLAFYENLVYY